MRPNGAQEALRLLEKSRGEEPHIEKTSKLVGTSAVIIAFAVHSKALYRFELDSGTLELRRFSIDRSNLGARIHDFVDSVRVGSHKGSLSVELSRLLIPVGLAEGTLLCFVPDRELAGIPFSALPLPDNPVSPLITRHEIVLANSIEGCEAAGRLPVLSGSGEKMLLVRSPKFDHNEFPLLHDLPAAADEAATLRALYPDLTLLANERVTAPALLQALSQATLLHFAGHAVAHPSHPSRSFLPLAPDPEGRQASLLSAAEIARLRLPNLKLAVLSACDTLMPRSLHTESISGLVRALLDAGVRAVVGTLWGVNDAESREFTERFYKNLRETRDAASALRETQRSMLSKSKSGPATWAAFELVVK